MSHQAGLIVYSILNLDSLAINSFVLVKHLNVWGTYDKASMFIDVGVMCNHIFPHINTTHIPATHILHR